LLAPDHPMCVTNQWLFDELENRTGGAITVEGFYNASLISGRETMQALRADTIDIGDLTIPYWPNELPLSDLLGVPFVTDDGYARAKAVNYLLKNDPALMAEYAAQNLVMLAFAPSETTMITSNKPINSFNDLVNLKTRSYGQFVPYVEAMGAFPVTVTWADVYSAAQSGLIKAICPTPYIDYILKSYYEVMNLFYDCGWGSFTLKGVAFSQGCWDRLDPRVKDIILELGEEWTDVNAGFMSEQMRAVTVLAEENYPACEFHVMTPEQKAEWVAPINPDKVHTDWVASLDCQEMWDLFLDKVDEYNEISEFDIIFDIWEELGVAQPWP